jgi:hypothetical protein
VAHDVAVEARDRHAGTDCASASSTRSVPWPTVRSSKPQTVHWRGSGRSAPQWWQRSRCAARCTVMRASQSAQGAIQPQALQAASARSRGG